MRAALAALALFAMIAPTAASDWGDSPYGAFTAARKAQEERNKLEQLVDLCEQMCKSNHPSCGKCLSTIALAEQRMRDRDERKSYDAMRRRLEAAEAEIRRIDDCTNPLSLNRLNCQTRLSPK